MKLAHEDRYNNLSSRARRNSELSVNTAAPGTPKMNHQHRSLKRHKRINSELPQHYQTVPNPSTISTGVPAFIRSNSSGSMKRPLSFIAGIASKVKNAFEGWQDSGSNRQSGKWSFNGTEFESTSDSSPNTPRKSLNTYPRIKESNHRLSVPAIERQWPPVKQRKNNSTGSFKPLNPSFAEVMEILSVPSSPELEPSPLREANRYGLPRFEIDNPHDVINENPSDVIKPSDLTKSGDVNVLVIGSESVGKSALIVRYLTKRFIGEYAPNVESIYDHSIFVDGKEVTIHVWDSAIPTMLQKTPESEIDKLPLLDPPDVLSMTSVSSSMRSSSSSTSSAYDNRISTSSFEDDSTMTSFHTSKPTWDNEYEKKSKKKKGKKELNNNNNKNKKENDMQIRLNWCDCVVVVYSICDMDSFESARDIIRFIRGQFVRGHAVSEFTTLSSRRNSNSGSGDSPDMDPVTRLSQIPILLVGNKADLEHRRRVDTNAATIFSSGYGCSSVELSVSEGFESVSKVFNDIVETIHRNKLPSKLTKIKSIVRTVSGGFGHRRNLSM